MISSPHLYCSESSDKCLVWGCGSECWSILKPGSRLVYLLARSPAVHLVIGSSSYWGGIKFKKKGGGGGVRPWFPILTQSKLGNRKRGS